MKKEKKEQTLKLLPVGIDDFEEIISKNYYFVDKSLLIEELLKSGAKSTLIPRPRRFGKTLNMSMLKCFFEKNKKSRAHLFKNLEIAKHKEIMKHQGKYPVIFITLKFIDSKTWEECELKVKELIADEYNKHAYLLESSVLNDVQKKAFDNIRKLKSEKVTYETSLRKLTEYIEKFHKKKPILLIDEFDVPIHAGFRHGYYDEVTPFIKSLLGDATKSNPNLEFAVLTGAMRIAKEGIFTGLNHVEVHTVFSDFYADKFGLLESEVKELLNYYGQKNKIKDVRSWYNGYSSGRFTVYNPWSIINLAKNNGKLQPYWINTSSNDIIRDLIRDGDEVVKEDVEQLISGSAITKKVREDIVYPEIEEDKTVLWNFLLFSGYLTFKKSDGTYADFLIPNIEVRRFFESTVLSWFEKQEVEIVYNKMIRSLVDGDIATFGKSFSKIVSVSFSYFDTSGKHPEKFYHACVLGMLVSLSDSYEVKSNRESGDGRYDVMLIPKDKSKLGIVIEFKKVDTSKKETIKRASTNALKQIKKMEYARELFSHGIKSVVGIGIAFKGKNVLIQSENLIVHS